MPKRFIFRPVSGAGSLIGKTASQKGVVVGSKPIPRHFAEPSPEQIAKAKETWKRLAPKAVKGLLK